MVPGYAPQRPFCFGGSRAGAAVAGWARPCNRRSPRPGRRCPAFVMYPRASCAVSVLFSLLRLLCLKLSGSLRPAGTILNTLVIFDAWLFTRSSKHHLWFQGWGCPKSLFQNQLVTSAPLIYALQTSEAIFKTGFYQCMQGGATPLLFLPRSNSMDSFHTYLPV